MINLPSLVRTLAALAITAVIAGCSALPRDGPTGRSILEGSSDSKPDGMYTIIDLNFETSERILSASPAFFGSLISAESASPGGAIGVGDVVSISIFEPGGSLFGGTSGFTDSGPRGSSQTLPPLTVDAAGSVGVPFAGSVDIAGLTETQAASAIRRALVGKIANPQVVVSISTNASSTVTVLGEVRSPGRAGLSVNSNRIIDVIADRGGATRPVQDLQVVIRRDGVTFTAPLEQVMGHTDENVKLAGGDQIELAHVPRRYSTFGAFGTVTLNDMGPGSLTLTEAVSRVGGLDTNSADADSVLVFRFERAEVARALGVTQPVLPRGVPVIYRLNFGEAEGMFTANNFRVESNDILYVPRSDSAELSKFFSLVQTVSRVVYDISVTSALRNE